MKTESLLSVLITAALVGACRPAASTPTVEQATQAAIFETPFEAPAPGEGRIAAAIEVNHPSNMTAGGGFLWVITGNSVVKIDPKTIQVVGEPIPAGGPEDVAFGEGALWVTRVGSGNLGAPSDIDSVSRIDPESGETVATIHVSRGPLSLAFTPEAVWVVNFGMSGDTVIRIHPQTNRALGDPIQTGRAPLSLAVGDGSVWVANHDARSVTRIHLASGRVIAEISIPTEPHRIAYGEGAVWVANWHDHSVTRIDPQANQIVGEAIPIGFPAGNITAGLGSVWVTSDYRGPVDADPEDVVLIRIDPLTNRAVETVPLGGHPIDVEIAGEAVWVSIQGPDAVLRIYP